MSFSQVPYELQEAILADQERLDLKRFCLVSKSFLEIARPLLYRSIKITFHSEYEERLNVKEEEDEDEEECYKYQHEEEATDTREGSNSESFEESFIQEVSLQAAILRTFGQHSDWKSYVKEVEVVIAEDPDQLVPELIHLISSFSALQSLEISSSGFTGYVCNKALDILLENCPPNLRSIYIDRAELKTAQLHQVLRKLPLLESLATPRLSIDEDPLVTTSYEAITLAHLKNLVIPHPSRPFFHSFTIWLPSLVSLSVDYFALPALDPSRLSTIQVLTISGYWIVRGG
ncbi:hypothetical protein JCM5350_007207 [Sporobolomyces pararoseus]